MLVGPVMAEWQKLKFSSTFELPGRVVNKLNEISNQIDAQGKSGQAGADESYELQYRDYLLQRFHRVEAGTVRMTTNLDVDLRELFVMPRVMVQELSQEADGAEDRAEYDAVQVQEIFATVLGDSERAARLLEHIRYRTGLLLERRPGIFGFAHLTFQEYLAARAVYEGNRLGVDREQLVHEHDDGRWKEVIALYSGLATKPAVRDLIEQLIAQADTQSLSRVLTEAYLSGGSELAQDKNLRRRVLERVAIAPASPFGTESLNRFPQKEVAPIVNALVGCIRSNITLSEAYMFLSLNPTIVNTNLLLEKLQAWMSMTPFQITEIIYLLHKYAPDEILAEIANITDLYSSVGPTFKNDGPVYYSQAEIALIGLSSRDFSEIQVVEGLKAVFRIVRSVLLNTKSLSWFTLHSVQRLMERELTEVLTLQNPETKQEFASLARKLATHLKRVKLETESIEIRESTIKALNNWANLLEGVKPEEKTSRKSASVKTQTNRNKPRKR
jgi:hypothetical protein